MSECRVSEHYIDRKALIEHLDQNCVNATKFFWRVGANNPSLRGEVTNRVLLLELAIDELKNGNKEPGEVTSYFEQLVQEELRLLNGSLRSAKAENKKRAAETAHFKKSIK